MIPFAHVGLKPQHVETMSRFIYLHPEEVLLLSDLRNMDADAFAAMLDALDLGAKQEAAVALGVAKMRLPAVLPHLTEFCPSTLEHILSGCGLAASAAKVRHQLGLCDEGNGLCELWELAHDYDGGRGSSSDSSSSNDNGTAGRQNYAEVKKIAATGNNTFHNLLEWTEAPEKLGVKLRADILAVACWWCVVSALFQTCLESERNIWWQG